MDVRGGEEDQSSGPGWRVVLLRRSFLVRDIGNAQASTVTQQCLCGVNVYFFSLSLLWTGCRECYSADGRTVARWKANQNKLGNEKTSSSKEYIRMWVFALAKANLPPHTHTGRKRELWAASIWQLWERGKRVLKSKGSWFKTVNKSTSWARTVVFPLPPRASCWLCMLWNAALCQDSWDDFELVLTLLSWS